ncbi:MAG: FAD-dependent oxidoreductase [Fusobacterium gastrosuis]|uniref:FAD-dependent oxidoreductase n=1 Tax=Fusobacterium gastrosuis TaxID=1755100 RepID=UPI002A9C8E97|nr:FAD-dependent oxidoreductase [Fusobacteriaceae bacterium]MDY5795900.1 FAD-dependent oxidoreductase [Fusobacterium gastrosuis]
MEKIYDIIVIGGGPAGLSAGIYAGRAKLDVLVIEKENKGGQISLTSEVVNYPGILEISGSEYMAQTKKQAEGFGVNFVQAEVTDMDFTQKIKIVKTTGGEYKALAVVIATGAAPRKLGFPGEKEFTGRGVAYCATCDGEFFTGMDIFVIGAGFAAAEEAMFLTKYGKSVTIIAREPDFTCAKSIGDKVKAHPKITVKFNTELTELTGDMKPTGAKFKNNVTGEVTEYKAKVGETFGVFVFVGYAPSSQIFKGHIEIDQFGFIPTNEDLMTNVPGVFAAGDIRPKRLRQVVTAVADGAIAATSIEKYAHDLREELGLKKEEKEDTKVTNVTAEAEAFLDEGLRKQLGDVVARFENQIELVVIKDPNNEESLNIENAVKEIAEISDKLKFTSYNMGENKALEAKIKAERFPTITILNKNGEYSGLKYSSIPSGHELNSFILGMYNVAGPGQKVSNEESLAKIAKIDNPINIKIGISLSCTKCPKTVQSAQRIATLNKNVEMEMINIFTFQDFKNRYDIMSVPAVVINDKHIYFGEKNIEDILEIINK